MKSKTAYLVLHDIRSAQNVGSLFRTADAAGIAKIYITGYTPAPLDKFNRKSKEIAKTALGAEDSVIWEKCSLAQAIKKLKNDEVTIVGIEQDPSSQNYRKAKPKFPIALILGNEVLGLDTKVRKLCDMLVEIPMQGKLARNRLKDDVGKESLNVSVAGGIAMFQMLGI